MASGGSFDEDDFYKRVLMSSQKRFVSDADPVALLDEFLQKEFIDHDLYRDISELALTSQKNRKIIETVRTKGKNGYRQFKECLRESDQGHLVDHLERNEKEVKQTARKKPTQTIKKVSDEDIAKIANAIGKNWELLAPALGLIDTEVDHLKMNYDTVELCIYQMLMTWKKRSGEAATLQNLLSKIQSMPSVTVNMDYIYNNVPGASQPASYQRSKFVEDMTVEIPVSDSQVKENENKHKQIEEQSWISNAIDGVSPVKERPERQLQEESYNKLKTMKAEDQIDAVGTQLSEPNGTEVTPSYENLNVNFNSKASVSVENQPIQVTDNFTNKIQSVISVLSSMTEPPTTHIPEKVNKSKLNQRSNPYTNQGVHFSKNITVDLPAESNDEISKKKLEEKFKQPQYISRRKSTHDGRLLILERNDFEYIKSKYNTQKPMEGGFGCVYISKEKIPPLDIKVAIKEIECSNEKSKHYERSISNEKLASRIMHFAIVPLLAMGCDKDKGIYWFLLPCLEKGDLSTLIANDTRRIDGHSMEDTELTRQRRLRIIYHISAAIDFLHTEIENFRGRIIHLDVKTPNVVLDPFYNARLTDFGVARETTGNDTSIRMTLQTAIPTTKGYFDPPAHSKLRKYFDYFNIGVVIRELLTGKPPYFQDPGDPKEMFLKNMETYMLEEIYIQGDIWNDKDDLCEPAKRMLILSQQCFDSAKNSEETKDKKLTSTKILNKMEDVVNHFCDGHAWERSTDKADDNCEMCLVNSSVEKDLLSHANCQCPLKVCVSCMRNSYLNPLRCHTCFQEIEPIIGSKWGAVLVAGRYDNDSEFSKSCSKDIADVEKVIISRCPLVIGIRKPYVRTITHSISISLEQDEDFTSRVQSAFNDLKQNGVRTIFFYFSGRFSKADDGFVMQTKCVDRNTSTEEQQYASKYLLMSEFKEMLRSFSEKSSDPTANEMDKNFIIVLDCAEAPILGFNDLESDTEMYRRIVQLNACGPNQTIVRESDGSIFKQFFIQGLTMKATKKTCHLEKYERCDICPIKVDDFITIGSLNTYITRHMEAYYKHLDREPAVPVQYTPKDAKIAYVVDTSAELNFILTFGGMQKDCSIACHFFNEISQLKEVLFDKFVDKMNVDKEKGTELQLSAGGYRDILQIIIKTGPKETHKLKLNSLEQIMSAWNGKRELFVEMRDIQTISDGMVGVFRETKTLLSFLQQYEKEEQAKRTIYRMDVDSFRQLKSPELLQLKKGVLALPKEELKLAELHIILPSMTDETGSRRHRDDFVCFKIEKKSSVGNC
ncbi:uncharacterized protein LOC128550230 [Mercenaria mercenaria]|uniref:uncharacterized protein LOC128550230 n=1 Tax=Mercenaria mercenaria TaxID=6596 RepID=UPI00234F12A7|nr:uncharacterized protein LOC128550230 [Mercenaria mercenaria]XP_053384812.1 uncharacterized protein LOC128550230 [Mercenaria mercenaria]